MAREMALTAAHVARVPPFDGGTGRLEGRDDLPAEAEWEAVADALLAELREETLAISLKLVDGAPAGTVSEQKLAEDSVAIGVRRAG